MLDASDKWLAFARGSASALGTILAMVAFVAIWVGILIWLDNRRGGRR